MNSRMRITLSVASFVFLIACASVQRAAVVTRSNYHKVWKAAIESVSDIGFAVSSTDASSGLIIADQGVVGGGGSVSRLNIQLSKEAGRTYVAVKFVPPPGTVGGNGIADKYVKALRQRVPDIKPAVVQ